MQEYCLYTGVGYDAFRDRWKDPEPVVSIEELQRGVEELNRNREQRERGALWPLEAHRTDRVRRAEAMAEDAATESYLHRSLVDGVYKVVKIGPVPRNAELMARVLATPESDAPRRDYARWLREQTHPGAAYVAAFIEGQLQLADGYRRDPRRDVKPGLPMVGFARPRPEQPAYPWWREPSADADDWPLRGTVEHVTIRAKTFLEIADELFSLAPIRQLTLTLCKGVGHRDDGILRALLQSPHLDRIRALVLPTRIVDQPLARLNDLTDRDLELIASSPHVRGVTYLDLPDAEKLTIAGFHALAASKHLPLLDVVRHDRHRFHRVVEDSAWGPLGDHLADLQPSTLAAWSTELERRAGRAIPWLHARERYGTDAPDIDAVVEYALATAGSS